MNSVGEKYTFWQLINKYIIVVPKIQRDYIQGRANLTVKKNREEFVEELTRSLLENRQMSLNFIYGTSDNGIFIPIDGQQRLTTLFLLHLYIFAKSNNVDKIKILQENFRYDTRYTTNRFLKRLAEQLPNILKGNVKYLQTTICDSGWYVSAWDSDPNVASTLVMLDLIHEKLAKEDTKIVAYNLVGESCPITFMSLKLKGFGSDNELYIRMNSRGKQLTDFENFKAELYEKVLVDSKKDAIQEFKKYIDGEWYSMFWDDKNDKYDNSQNGIIQTIEKRAISIDNLLKHAFHWIILSSICEDEECPPLSRYSKDDKNESVRKLYFALQPSCDINRYYVEDYLTLFSNINQMPQGVIDHNGQEDLTSKREFCTERLKSSILNNFSKTFSFLNKIKEDKVFAFLINDIFKISSNQKNVITYTVDQYGARILLYAIMKFVEIDNNENNIDGFKSWYRVMLNLVSNSEIDSPEDFYKVINQIKLWKGDTKEWLDKLGDKGPFRSEQITEERLKLDLLDNANLKNAILYAENTDFNGDYKERDYFRGQIGFLLNMAGITSKDNANKDNVNKESIAKFRQYTEMVKIIFKSDNYWDEVKEDEIKNKPQTLSEIKTSKGCSFDNLFHRAMLTCGNYWIDAPGQSIKTFFVYSEPHNTYDWKGAFRKYNMAIDCLKNLFDGCKDNVDFLHDKDKIFDEFKSYLGNQIDNYNQKFGISQNKNLSKEDKLCKLLITNPNCFKYIKNNYYIHWNEESGDYELMHLKRLREGSKIDIKDKILD